MNQFLVHFFPLFTIFLFGTAAVYFFRHVNSIRKVEKYMESNRPIEWEELGKPSVFSGKYSEKNIKLKQYIDAENEKEERDVQMEILWNKSKRIKRTLIQVTWAAFGTYIFTIFAVHFLLAKIQEA